MASCVAVLFIKNWYGAVTLLNSCKVTIPLEENGYAMLTNTFLSPGERAPCIRAVRAFWSFRSGVPEMSLWGSGETPTLISKTSTFSLSCQAYAW